jgi:hypothetical protein
MQPPPNTGFPTTDASDKKFYRSPVAPTICLLKPFGLLVEGLVHLWEKSYAFTTVYKWRGAGSCRSG